MLGGRLWIEAMAHYLERAGAGVSGSLSLGLRVALVFAKTGLFTFGSGYAMLNLMQREIVDQHGWLTPEQFADLVALAEVTPGPITVNMATFVGYRLGGLWGALAATGGLIIGPMAVILLVVRFYGELREQRYVDAAFRGLRPTVLALILIAVLRLGQTALVDLKGCLIFGGILVALYFFQLSPLLAAVIGVVLGLILYG